LEGSKEDLELRRNVLSGSIFLKMREESKAGHKQDVAPSKWQTCREANPR